LGFASGILIAVLVVSTVFMLLQTELMNFMTHGMIYIDVAGFALLALIGTSYITGISLGIPLPTINPPASLMSRRGVLAAPLYGLYFGAPGAAHCTLMLVIPIIFLSLSSLNPAAFLVNFAAYAVGRVIPVIAIGMMLQDAQLRFLKLVASRSQLVNRVIGVVIVLSGISLFFVR
jgi:cytochrome c biogenesis protein CcdA